MGLPGHRRTSSHKKRRASHFALVAPTLSTCPSCKKPIRPHTMCGSCGKYKGREIIKIKLPKKKA